MATITLDLMQNGLSVAHAPHWNDATAKAALDEIGEAIRTAWGQAVTGAMLPGMREPISDQHYRNLILAAALDNPDPATVQILIHYIGAWRYEHGHRAYDMKPHLLSSPKAKVGKKGRYMVVGFVPKQGKPPKIYAPMGGRSLIVTEETDGGMSALPGFGGGVAAQTEKAPQAKGALGNHIFRAVSDMSPSQSWIVPALPPNPIMTSVAQAVEPIAAAILQRHIQRALDGVMG